MTIRGEVAGKVLAQIAPYAVFGLFVYFMYRKQKSDNPEAFDPTSPNNLAYKGANAIGAALTNDPAFSIGSTVFDGFNMVKKPFWFLHTEPDLTAPTPPPRVYQDVAPIDDLMRDAFEPTGPLKDINPPYR